jgi:hypothetical protein
MAHRSFEAYFNGLDHPTKVRLANRRIQHLDLDIRFAEVMGVHPYEWLLDTRNRWLQVRDRLVWDGEEVVL